MEENDTGNVEARVDATATALYRRVSERAASFDVGISPEELAELAVRLDMGKDELAALEAVFAYLADKHHDQVIETLLKLSRLPQKAPKTFEGFDFDRIRGRDAAALRKLPALSNLHARKNLAFIGPGGIGNYGKFRIMLRNGLPPQVVITSQSEHRSRRMDTVPW